MSQKTARDKKSNASNGVTPKPLRGGLTTEQVTFAQLILGKIQKPKMPMPTPTISSLPNTTPVIQSQPQPEQVPNAALDQSRKQKELIAKAAQTNQTYYLERARLTGTPWFKNPKQEFQYSEFVLVTPEMAKVALESLWRHSEGNRNEKPMLTDSYRRDMENDRWISTDEAIGVNLDKEVYNGQHRLSAVSESNKSVILYFTWNVLNEAKFVVDSGAIRNVSERLKLIADPMLGNRTSGFCKAIMRGLTSKTKYSSAEIAEFANKWQSLLNWISEHYPIGRAEVQAAIAKAYLWYGPELIEPFCSRLRNINFTDTSDPARALYVALSQAKRSNVNLALVSYKKTLQAIDCLVNNRPLSRIYERNIDIFEWMPGWEVPPKDGK